MYQENTELKIFVTALKGQGTRLMIFGQTDFDAWAQLEDLLADPGMNATPKLTDVNQIHHGDIFLAKYQQDGAWYRAQVVSTNTEERTVTVNFIDFGNCEVVGVGDITKITENFLELPPQAEKFLLGDILPSNDNRWSSDELSYMKDHLTNVEFRGKVIETSSVGKPPTIRLLDSEGRQSPFVHGFLRQGIGKKMEAHVISQNVPELRLTPGKTYNVFVSYSESPLSFWIQLVDNADQLENLHAEIESSLQQVSNIMPGKLCVAQYEGVHCRAVIDEVDELKSECSVTFFDYGNSAKVPFSDVKALSPTYAQFPAQGVACCSTGKAVGKSNFNSIVEIENLQMTVHKVLPSGVHIVHLSEAGTSQETTQPSVSSERARTKSIAYTPMSINSSSLYNVCISCVDNHGGFYAQLLDNAKRLDGLLCELQEEKLRFLENFSEGDACVAKIGGLFFRAEVIDASSQNIVVRSVDFGNHETVSRQCIFVVPELYFELPVQSFKCVLTKSGDADPVSTLRRYESKSVLIAKIIQKTNAGFEVELIDTSTDKDKRLCLGNDQMILSQPVKNIPVNIPFPTVDIGTEEGLFVTAVLSDEEFFGQLSKFPAEKLDMFQQKLASQYTSNSQLTLPSPAIGNLCCTMFSEDGLHYRSKIESISAQKATVLFVDYGNYETKALSDLKELLDEFCQLPMQGIRCSLAENYIGLTRAILEATILEQEIKVVVQKKSGTSYQVLINGCEQINRLRKRSTTPSPVHRPISHADSQLTELKKQVIDEGTWKEIIVPHIEDPEHIYCQLVAFQDDLNSLMEEIDLYAKALPFTKLQAGLGVAVIAKYSDGDWYRGTITGVKSNGAVEVHFVDYGNQDLVQPTDLRPITPALMSLPCQALPCSLAGIACSEDGIWPEAVTEDLVKRVDKTLVAYFGAFDEIEEHYAVEIFDGSVSMNESFGRSIQMLSRSFRSSGPPPNPLPSVPVATNVKTKSSESASRTWARGFEESNKKSQEASAAVADNFDSGGWSEGPVVSKVRDSGFRENSQKSSFRPGNTDQGFDGSRPNERSSRLGNQNAVESGFSGGRKSGFDRDGASRSQDDARFGDSSKRVGTQNRFGGEDGHRFGSSDRSRDDPCQGQDQGSRRFGSGRSSEDRSFASRSSDERGFGSSRSSAERGFGSSKSSEERGLGSARSSTDRGPVEKGIGMNWSKSSPVSVLPKLQLVENKYCDVFVSYALSPSKFWCQLKENANGLDTMMEELAAEYDTMNPQDLFNNRPSEAQLVCAKFSEDGVWYRAKVTEISGDKVNVLFVDYGNTEAVNRSDIKLLKENYTKLPFQAFQCALSGVEPKESGWNPEAITKFQELTIDKQLVACILEKRMDTYAVELVYKSNVIHEDLISSGLAKSSEEPLDISSKKSLRRSSTASTGSRASSSSKTSLVDKEIKELSLANNKHVDLNVAHINSPADFFCQLTENTSVIEKLMVDIGLRYGNISGQDLLLSKPQVGQYCCGKYPEDNEWYRAVINEVGNDKLRVKFIDYGNEEWLNLDQVRELDGGFFDVKGQAVRCGLYGLNPKSSQWSQEAIDKFHELTEEKNLVGKVLARREQTYLVRLVDVTEKGEAAIEAELVRMNLAKKDDSVEKTFLNMEVQMAAEQTLVPVWVKGAMEFYLQLEQNKKTLEKMSEDLFEFYQKLRLNDLRIQDPHIGQACVSYYAQDGSWYRGIIQKLRTNEALVFYVDYGNKAKVPLSKVKEISAPFLKIPQQALKCGLHGLKYPDDKWNDQAISVFQRALTNVLQGKILAKEGDLHLVELKDKQGVSVVDNLNSICSCKGPIKPAVSKSSTVPVVNESDDWGAVDSTPPSNIPQLSAKVDKPAPLSIAVQSLPETIPQSQVQVYVSSVISPSSFYVQLVDDATDLEQFSELVNNKMADGGTTLGSAKYGSICAAKFSEDGFWYRARVTHVLGDQVTVVFVDYGNRETLPVGEIKMLKPELAEKAMFGIECTLANATEPVGGWLEKDVTKFEEATGSGEKELSATFAKKGTKCEVTLVDGNLELSGLFAAVEKAVDAPTIASAPEVQVVYPEIRVPSDIASIFISHVESPGDFHVNLMEQSENLDMITSKLEAFQASAPLVNPVVGRACVAAYDGAWYRASILMVKDAQYTVSYIDYGNKSTVNSSEIFELPQELGQIPPCALPCTLAGVNVPTSGWPDDSSAKLLELGEDGAKELTALFVGNRIPYQIKLTDGNVDINQEIQNQFGAHSLSVDERSETNVIPDIPPDIPDDLPATPEQQNLDECLPQDKLPPGKYQVCVTHVESPAEVYLQLSKHTVEIEQLIDKVDTKYGCMPDDQLKLDSVSAGQLCCAKYSADNVWYRAKVLECNQDGYVVQFLDYGNSDVVPLSSIKELTSDFRRISIQIYKFCLAGTSSTADDYSDEVINKLVELTSEKILSAVVNTDIVPATVILYDKEECINKSALGDLFDEALLLPGDESTDGTTAESVDHNDDQVKDSISVPDIQEPEEMKLHPGTVPVFVSAVNTPSEFYMQLVAQDQNLKDHAASMLSYYTAKADDHVVTSPVKSKVVCARYRHDDSWCRTKIEDIQEDGVKLLFMDYGNFDIVDATDLYQLVPKFCTKPYFATKCCLLGFEGRDDWTDEQINDFLIQVQESELTAVVKETGDTHIVELFNGERNIGKELFGDASCGITSVTEDSSPLETRQVDSVPENQLEDGDPTGESHEIPVQMHETTTEHISHEVQENATIQEAESQERNEIINKEETASKDDDSEKDETYESADEDLSDKTEATEQATEKDGNINKEETTTKDDSVKDVTNESSGEELSEKPEVTQPATEEDGDIINKTDDDSVKDETYESADENLSAKTGATEQATEEDSNIINREETTTKDDSVKEVTHESSGEKLSEKTEVSEQAVKGSKVEDEVQALNRSSEDTDSSSDSSDIPEPVSDDKVYEKCPRSLKVSEKAEVYVSDVVSPGQFWSQKAGSDKTLGPFSEELASFCDSDQAQSITMENLYPGLLLAAKYSEDDHWYRAKVLEIDEDSATVLFIDYGGKCSVKFTDFRSLDENFKQQPPVAFECVLANIKAVGDEWSEKAITRFKEITEEKKLLLEVVMIPDSGQGDQEIVYVVRLLDMGMSVADTLLKEELCVNIANAMYPATSAPETLHTRGGVSHSESGSTRKLALQFAESSPQPVESYVPCCNALAVGSKVEVQVSHVNSPDEFYLHFRSNLGQIDTLTDNIQQYYENNKDEVENTDIVGQIIVAKSSDGFWYRAHLLDVDGDNLKVQYVDYGNREIVSWNAIQLVTGSFRELPFQAICCKLCGIKSSDNTWSDDVIDQFHDLVDEKVLLVVVNKCLPGYVYEVDLLDMGISIPGLLVEKNLAVMIEPDVQGPEHSSITSYRNPDIKEDSVLSVFVSHAETPHAFWAQPADTSSEELPLLQDLIHDYCSNLDQETGKLQSVEAGSPCIGLCGESWYRAEITQIQSADSVEIYFVDYGNSEVVTVSSLRRALDDHLVLPKQAFQCKFTQVLPLSTGKWDEACCDRFHELVMYEESKSLNLKVDKVMKEGDTLLYVEGRLYDGDSDIAQLLVDGGYAKLQSGDVTTGQLTTPDTLVTKATNIQSPVSAPELNGEQIVPGPIAAPEYPSPEFLDSPEGKAQISDFIQGVIEVAQSDVSASLEDVMRESEQDGDEKVSDNLESGSAQVNCNNNLVDITVTDFSEGEQTEGCKEDFENSFLEVSIQKSNSLGSLAENEAFDFSDNQVYRQVRYAPGTEIDMIIQSANDPDNIICQPTESSYSLQLLMERLGQIYSAPDVITLECPQVGQPCCAQFSEDKSWYRAQILNICDGLFEVDFVDYGNSEKVPSSCVKLLDQVFLELPSQAVRCSVNNIKPSCADWSEDVVDLLSSLVIDDDSPVKFTVIDVDVDGRLSGKFTLKNGDDLGGLLMMKGLAVEDKKDQINGLDDIDSDDDDEAFVMADSIRSHQLTVGETRDVFLSCCNNPDHMFCQIQTDDLDIMMEAIDLYYSSHELKQVREWVEGDICCAKSSAEGELWYRSQVQSCYGKLATVHHIDFGTVETVEMNSLSPLLAKFSKHPRFAVECQLYGVRAVSGTWAENTGDVLSDECEHRPLVMVVKQMSESGLPIVTLTPRNGSSLGEVLVARKLARSESYRTIGPIFFKSNLYTYNLHRV